MRKSGFIAMFFTSLVFVSFSLIYIGFGQDKEDHFITYTYNSRPADLKLYWKDDKGQQFKSIQRLKDWLGLHHKTLLFAMNAGMYRQGNLPQGLYIEDGIRLSPLDTANGSGNFYLKPNGVFYITKAGTAGICSTQDYINNSSVKYATQSGPMLLINGIIHSAFKQGSQNLNIRNGVGILPDKSVVFAMSKKEINFYDFAAYFKSLGCTNALYLDGFVSRTYLPEKSWVQTDGDFAAMIGVTKEAK